MPASAGALASVAMPPSPHWQDISNAPITQWRTPSIPGEHSHGTYEPVMHGGVPASVTDPVS